MSCGHWLIVPAPRLNNRSFLRSPALSGNVPSGSSIDESGAWKPLLVAASVLPKSALSDRGRGGVCVCPGRKPKGRRGLPPEGFPTPRSGSRGDGNDLRCNFCSHRHSFILIPIHIGCDRWACWYYYAIYCSYILSGKCTFLYKSYYISSLCNLCICWRFLPIRMDQISI